MWRDGTDFSGLAGQEIVDPSNDYCVGIGENWSAEACTRNL
jgi:hypothetical protein